MKRILMAAGAAVLIGVAAWLIAGRLRPVDYDKELDRQSLQTAKALVGLVGDVTGGEGKLIVLYSLPDENRGGTLRKALEAVLKKEGRYEILASETYRPRGYTPSDPDSIEAMTAEMQVAQGVAPQYLLELAGKHPGADAFLSLAGEPLADARLMPSLKGKVPPVVCLSMSGEFLPGLFREGVVVRAVAPKRRSVPMGSDGSWFEVMFDLVTPDNVDAWWTGTL